MEMQELLKKYFSTADLYEMLKIKKTAPEKEIKKAYYKLSLEVHPDRVDEKDKEEATEKFKLLSKAYQILTDDNKRKLYDERGIIGDDDDISSFSFADMINLWRSIFRPISTNDIDEYKSKFVGSDLERKDIKSAYLSAKGCINKMMSIVPFLGVSDEPRLQKIVGEMIAAGEVPEYAMFTKEPAQKRARRHKKAEREFKDAERHREEIEARSGGLEKLLQQRHEERSQQFGSMLQNIVDKYGNGDDEEDIFDLGNDSAAAKKIKKKLNGSRQKKTPIKNSDPNEKLHQVKNGRVHKKN